MVGRALIPYRPADVISSPSRGSFGKYTCVFLYGSLYSRMTLKGRIEHGYIYATKNVIVKTIPGICQNGHRSKVRLFPDRLRKQSRILPDPRGLVREGGRVRQDSAVLHRRPHEEPPGVKRLDSSLTLRQIKLWPLL